MASKNSDLVIVESPAKARTIEKYLGEGFTVLSSYGHVRDLKARDLSVDVENDFEPTYEIPEDKQAVINKLKAQVKKATTVWLATDEDREGEAISWHLQEALDLDDKKVNRITFHEITKPAIQAAIEKPRKIDKHLVDAQQARRVLDRLVGYELSPILWRKVKPSLSAGRVQSVAVRIIVEREREILAFNSTSAFRVVALLTTDEGKQFRAELPTRFATADEAKAFLSSCSSANFTISKVEKKPGKRNPAAPFTTSTLQQEASRKLSFSVTKTMMMAQRLYEAGQITYMRTDSVNISELAINAAEQTITKMYGEKYSKQRRFATKSKGAQEAHEAIRPTDLNAKQVDAERDAARLYELIWKRTIASQMAEAELERTTLEVSISTVPDQQFVSKGEVITFDGFLAVYFESTDDEEEEQEGMLPAVREGEVLQLNGLTATERFDRPSPRYTEASLVKKLEELGIGRPSTFAPTIGTIQKRGYVVKESRDGTPRNYQVLKLENSEVVENLETENTGVEKNKLFPTDIGMVVNDFLVEHFGDILAHDFTATVEAEFDQIADGELAWKDMIRRFYEPFHKQVELTAETAEKATGARLLGVDPKSGRNMYARIGRFGPMIQVGEAEDEEKPKFASLMKDQSIQTITFEEANELFKLPRDLGEHEGEPLIIGVGRYGPYVKHGTIYASLQPDDDPLSIKMPRAIELLEYKKKLAELPREIGEYEGETLNVGRGRFGPYVKFGKAYVSLERTDDPFEITLERAIELIKAKQAKDAAKLLRKWDEAPEVQVIEGRWGPYITDGEKNAKMPKGKGPEDVTLEECKALLAAAPAKKSRRKGAAKKATKKTAKKKTVKKKTAKKKATKKATKKK